MGSSYPTFDHRSSIRTSAEQATIMGSTRGLSESLVTRRGLLVAGLAGGVIVATAGCSSGGARGSSNQIVTQKSGESDKDYLKRLYEAAKAEAQVMLYGEANNEEYQADRKALAAAYPGVDLRFVSGNQDVMTQREITEEGSGHAQADVYHGSSYSMAVLDHGGALETYHAVNRKNMDRRFVLNGPYTPNTYLTKHVVFNTKMMSASEMPHTWEGYLDPRFKGKMALDVSSDEWVAGLMLAMGKQRTRSFLEKLTKMQVIQVDGTTLRTEQLAAGDFPIMLDGYGHSTKKFIDEGKPIQVVVPAPDRKITAIVSMSALLKGAPHPNSARLLSEFFLTSAGQQVFLHENKPGTLKGIKNPYEEYMKGSKLLILSPGQASLLKTAGDWWQELFAKK